MAAAIRHPQQAQAQELPTTSTALVPYNKYWVAVIPYRQAATRTLAVMDCFFSICRFLPPSDVARLICINQSSHQFKPSFELKADLRGELEPLLAFAQENNISLPQNFLFRIDRMIDTLTLENVEKAREKIAVQLFQLFCNLNEHEFTLLTQRFPKALENNCDPLYLAQQTRTFLARMEDEGAVSNDLLHDLENFLDPLCDKRLFYLATHCAHLIQDQSDQRRLFPNLYEALIKNNQIDWCRECIQRIRHPEARDCAWSCATKALFERTHPLFFLQHQVQPKPYLDLCVDFSSRINGAFRKDYAFMVTSRRFAELNCKQEAIQLAQQIQDESMRTAALDEIESTEVFLRTAP
jgi:hypothetical protein